MPINKQSILSVYDDKLTLVQWLKKVEDALKNDTLKNVELLQDGDKVAFKFVFEDSEIITDYLELQANSIDTINYDSRSQEIVIVFTDGTVRVLGPLFDANSNVTLQELEAQSVSTKVLNADSINVDGDINCNGSIDTSDEVKSDDITARNTISSFERLIDANGNFRFVEGDIEIEEIAGITKTYGKWSLSGTHLMIVLVLNIANATALTFNTLLANLNLPQWIKNKINTITSNIVTPYVSYPGFLYSQNLAVGLRKDNDNVGLYAFTYTAQADNIYRVELDLLIDAS